MCIACLGAHLDTLESHFFENMNIELEDSRLNLLRCEIEKKLNYIKKTKSYIIKRTRDLIKTLGIECKQEIEKLELLSKDLIELYKHNKFCKSEMLTVEKIESDKVENDIGEKIESITLPNFLIKSQNKSNVNFEEDGKSEQRSVSNYFQIKIDNCFQNNQVTCPREHSLKFFSNIEDRSRADKNSMGSFFCDICGAHSLESCWSCIECIYDVCEPCYNSALQNTQAKNVSKNFEFICPKNHKLVDYSLIEKRILDAKIPRYSKIRCSYCNCNDLKSAWSCIMCNFDLCQQCSNDQIYSKPALNFTNQFCPSSHPLFYYQNTSEFIKRKNNCFSDLSCNACLYKWNGGSWACRLCDFYLCIRCIHLKEKFAET